MDSLKWLPVVGYDGLYEVSESGDVRSLFRYKKTLKHSVMKNGYHTVELFKDKKRKRVLVHRIVADAFIHNTGNLPQVNHKDENKSNNAASNLEWCTAKYNINYGSGSQRRRAHCCHTSEARKITAIINGKKASRPVIMLTKDGAELSVFESGKQASRDTGINHSHILECCSHKRKSAGGFLWKYK